MEAGGSEQDLVRRAAGGDEDAFDALVRRHTAQLHRLVRRMTADRAEAEAVVQDAWLRAWRARDRCAADRPFFPWIAAIATNAARDAWRKRRPLDFADLGEAAEAWAAEGPSVEVQIETEEAKARLARFIQDLRPEWRIVVALRYDAGLEYTEIADVLGVPLNTVRTHLRRARQALRRRLEAEDG